ncbi:MAG: hypothetical protein K6E53_14675 [Lachnospiraceae bacterium]|nr:hypothetical protein [Lachnospiraceae bacterium]
MNNKEGFSHKSNKSIIYVFLLLIISLYSLRWSATGLDLWDSGYNCVNYVNFGPQQVTPKLFFSTYLSDLLGHLFTLLPYGDTYIGMRILCGLVIVTNVFISGMFCIRKLNLKGWMVVAGEVLAVSICYSPSVILYNHLSFLFFNISLILIYLALTEKKSTYLVTAGFVLGMNVFVRFSNVPQVMLILAVWYASLLNKEKIADAVNKTILCIAGFISSVIVMLLLIGNKYGVDAYTDGIRELFSMTEEAAEYSPVSMVIRMFDSYIRGARRLADILLFSVMAFAVSFIVILIHQKKEKGNADNTYRTICLISVISGVCLCVFFIIRMLMQFDFHHYITILLTVAMYLDVLLLICFRQLVKKDTVYEERIMSAIMILYMITLSVGSNTTISPVMNSMFIAAPYLIYGIWEIADMKPASAIGLIRESIETDRISKGKLFAGTAVIVSLIAFTAFFIQCIAFGASYCYQEAENGSGGSCSVNNNRVLTGIHMDDERAKQLQGLSDYINGNDLHGKGVIIYGYAPALAYYLDLKPAIASWPDLDSYNLSEMEEDVLALKERIGAGEEACPIVILDNVNLEEQIMNNPQKWKIIENMLDEYGYDTGYDDGRFVVMNNDDI